MPGDPHVRFGGRGHRTQSMLPTPYNYFSLKMEPLEPGNGGNRRPPFIVIAQQVKVIP
jgi:hypothetical protein